MRSSTRDNDEEGIKINKENENDELEIKRFALEGEQRVLERKRNMLDMEIKLLEMKKSVLEMKMEKNKLNMDNVTTEIESYRQDCLRYIHSEKKVNRSSSFESLSSLQEEHTQPRSPSIHVTRDHLSASFIEEEIKLCAISTERSSIYRLFPLMSMNIVPKIDASAVYDEEAHIASIIDSNLKEAIDILRNNRFLKSKPSIFRERSLFSDRSDILVIRTETYREPLLVLQVKKPAKKGSSLAIQSKPLGQAFDIVQSFKARGNEYSSIVVTSLKESFVCWNSNDKGTTKLYNDGCFQPKQNPTPTIDTTPISSRSADILGGDFRKGEQQMSLFSYLSERCLARSRVFKAHELVHLLCTAIVCNVSAMENSNLNHVDNDSTQRQKQLDFGNVHNHDTVLRFTTGERNDPYFWGTLKGKIGTTIKSVHAIGFAKQPGVEITDVPQENSKAYYLTYQISHSNTSSIWHALDSKGDEVVIKTYLKGTDNNGRLLRDEEFNLQAGAAAKKEAALLRSLYECFNESLVYTIQLKGFHCLVLPYLKQVPKNERMGKLSGVKRLLERLYDKNLMYQLNDLRWRHVGIYNDDGSDTLILFDLADLKKSTDKEELAKLSWLARANYTTSMNEQGIVHIHYTIMRQRMNSEK